MCYKAISRDYMLTVEAHKYYDQDPRKEFSNLGHMVCWHRRYTLGDDKHASTPSAWLFDMAVHLQEEEGKDTDKAEEWARERPDQSLRYVLEHPRIVALPIYLFDHSGLSVSTRWGSFFAVDSAGWDWGQVGWIYARREEILQNENRKRLTKKMRKRAEEILRNEVLTYNQYLTGDVWYYTLHDLTLGQIIDSCGGFFGLAGSKEAIRQHLPTDAKNLVDALEWK